MMRYSIELITRKYVKGYLFFSFVRNLSDKYWKKLLNTATKARTDVAKTGSKKKINKVAETTGELIGKKLLKKKLKPKSLPNQNSRNVQEIVFPPEKIGEILDELR